MSPSDLDDLLKRGPAARGGLVHQASEAQLQTLLKAALERIDDLLETIEARRLHDEEVMRETAPYREAPTEPPELDLDR